ncbi:MAG: DUF805 domain-containing protein [Syntrophomonadaceae bacterium]|nr:DUF805 domain-containing protein [Syntrophomonadaceae bacterium]
MFDTILQAYLKMFMNYVNFSDRTNRPDFWWAVLGNVIVCLVLGIIIAIIPGLKFLYTLYSLAILIPGLALGIRRLHDIGKSGWFILVGLIPIIGLIWLIILYCKESVPEQMSGSVG